MSDDIKQRARDYLDDVKLAGGTLVRDLLDALEREERDHEGTMDTLTLIGDRTTEIVNMIRGVPEDGTLHSTHDVVELVADLKAKLEAGEAQYLAMKTERDIEKGRVNTLFEKLERAEEKVVREARDHRRTMQELAKAREALAFYADRENWTPRAKPGYKPPAPAYIPAHSDGGQRAREALDG